MNVQNMRKKKLAVGIFYAVLENYVGQGQVEGLTKKEVWHGPRSNVR